LDFLLTKPSETSCENAYYVSENMQLAEYAYHIPQGRQRQAWPYGSSSFEYNLAVSLLELREDLLDRSYRFGSWEKMP